MSEFFVKPEDLEAIPTYEREAVDPKGILGFGSDEKGIYMILNDGTVVYNSKGVTDNGDGTFNVRSKMLYCKGC